MSDKVKTERIGLTQAKLLEKAKSLPKKAGCYLMRDRNDRVLYVGKAKSLKARVSSYFQNGAKSPKTEILVSHIRDFDFVLTETESEAFVLENNLIKKHSPKYNIMMRDDKSYPYVVIDKRKNFPRLLYQRRVKREKGVEVFGPFVHGSNISEVLRIVTKSFQLRDCTDREMNSRKEPCLLYQIHQCSAPCVNKISNEDYQKDIDLALNFFKGKGKKSLKVLKERMHTCAEGEEFERAAIIRDHIEVLEEFLEFGKQENAELKGETGNIDILSFYPGEIEIDIALYLVRNGILLGHKNFHFPTIDVTEEIEEEVMGFMFQYYSSSHDSLPEVIVSDLEEKNHKIFSKGIETLGKIKVKKPGQKYSSLLKLTKDQAFEHQRVRLSNEDSVYLGLNKFKDLLGLKERPVVLECYDIAIFQGTSPTAAQIVFVDGKPDKKNYRHYHLEVRDEGNNDFAMMKEVLTRRLKKGNLPDVFIVDGGKGQVSIFQGVLKDFEIDIPVVGVAKSKTIVKKGKTFKEENIKKSEERLIIPGRANPYFLNKNKALFKIVTHMRDEAHRFSRRLHHKAEKKRVLTSWVDKVPGLGPKAKENILRKLDKTTEEILEMDPRELRDYFEISDSQARNILKALKE